METKSNKTGKNQPENYRNGQPVNPQNGLFGQTRKSASGAVYSFAVFFSLLAAVIFSFILSAVVKSSGSALEDFKTRDWYKYLNFLLPQIAYLGAIMLFAFVFKEKPVSFGYRKAKPIYFILALPLAFGLLFSLNWVNGKFIELLSLMGYTDPSVSDPNLTSREYALLYQIPSLAGGGIIGATLVIAVMPAFMEETVFRGIMLEGIKDIGTVAACLSGGLLFSLFHQNPAQTIYQFICGAVFTLMAIRSGSIFPSVLMHFINNAVILLDYRLDFLSKVTGAWTVVFYVLSAVCLVGVLSYLIFFDKKTNRKKEGKIKPFLMYALVGLILCCVLWLVTFVSGFGG